MKCQWFVYACSDLRFRRAAVRMHEPVSKKEPKHGGRMSSKPPWRMQIGRERSGRVWDTSCTATTECCLGKEYIDGMNMVVGNTLPGRRQAGVRERVPFVISARPAGPSRSPLPSSLTARTSSSRWLTWASRSTARGVDSRFRSLFRLLVSVFKPVRGPARQPSTSLKCDLSQVQRLIGRLERTDEGTCGQHE
jgi:hypothetical protein